MPAQYYIHNIYNENVTSIFGKQKMKEQLEYQQRQITALNRVAKSKYSKMFGDNKQYMEALEKLEHALPFASQQMVQNLPTLSWGGIRQALGAGSEGMLQAAITKMKNDLAKYEQLYNELQQRNGNPKSATWFSEDDMSRLENLAGRISKVKSELDTLDVKADNRWGVSKRLSTVVATTGGYVSEYGMADLLNQYLAGSGLRARQVGTGSGGEMVKSKQRYSTGTTDIVVEVVGGNGKVVIQLPGITLKRTSTGSKKNPSINIHLKSTTVGKLIEMSRMAGGGFDLATFYNAYANANRETLNFQTQKTVVNRVTGMGTMYKAFKQAALATALTGSMNANDFAYYLVINEQVFTASEIVAGVLAGNGSVVGGQVKSLAGMSVDEILNSSQNISLESAQPALARKHSELLFNKYLTADDDKAEADARSNEVIQLINNLHISLNLKMNLAV